MTSPAVRFCRVQAKYFGRLGVEIGVFVAVDHLRRAGKLSADEIATYLDIDDWFSEHLPEPGFYEDGNSIGAVTWFKTPIPPNMAERVESLIVILRTHDVPNEIVFAHDPGSLVYEDDFQVGVIPTTRKPQTPMPAALALGPTAAGSKRDLPHGP